MVFDGRVDLAGVGGDRQPLGEGVERAHLALALLRNQRMGARPRRELARHRGDDDEQDEVENMLRLRDAKIVDRLVEEECRRGDAADRGGDCGSYAEPDGGGEDGYEIDARDVVQHDELRHAEQAQRQTGNEREGDRDPPDVALGERQAGHAVADALLGSVEPIAEDLPGFAELRPPQRHHFQRLFPTRPYAGQR